MDKNEIIFHSLRNNARDGVFEENNQRHEFGDTVTKPTAVCVVSLFIRICSVDHTSPGEGSCYYSYSIINNKPEVD